MQGTCKCGRHVGSSPASSRASRIGPPGGRFYACFHSSQTSGCSETIESVRNPPETGWDGLGCFPAVVRWSQTVTSTCGGPAVGRARGLPKFYNKCCRFYNKLQQSVTTAIQSRPCSFGQCGLNREGWSTRRLVRPSLRWSFLLSIYLSVTSVSDYFMTVHIPVGA